MRVPDEIRKCVAFVFYEAADGPHLAGTAFFLAVPTERDPDEHFVYIVTAKHVIDGIRMHSVDGTAFVRVNDKDGGSSSAPISTNDWIIHPDQTQCVDVAAFRGTPTAGHDYLSYSISLAATDEVVEGTDIGVGDEVFITGLFVNHAGRERNIPIVRVGTIAAMPEEPVSTRLGSMDAYLVEARSIGGLSGSPVFVHYGPVRVHPESGNYQLLQVPQHALLGLMHGHWKVTVTGAKNSGVLSITEEAVNMGIGIVVPVAKILEVVNQPSEVAFRKAYESSGPAAPSLTLSNEESRDLT